MMTDVAIPLVLFGGAFLICVILRAFEWLGEVLDAIQENVE